MDDKTVRRRKTGNKPNVASTDRIKYGGRTNAQTSERKCGFCKILLIIFALIVFILALGYVFSPIKAVAIEGIVDVSFEGVFSIKKKLSGKRIPNLPGAECIVEDDEGNLYTGLHDGRIVKIHRSPGGVIGVGRIENITSGVIDGADISTDDIPHGRPLGIRLRGNMLYVMDTIYGFCSIDLKTRKLRVLVPPSASDPPMRFQDDFDITADGTTVYFSDASSKYPITRLGAIGMDGSCSGRLFKYTFASNKLEILVSDLCFCNGVQLSPDGKTLIVAETLAFRLRWFDTETWKTKRLVHTPMMPDNVRLTNRGTLLVCGAQVPSAAAKVMYGLPAIRQALAGLIPKDLLSLLLLKYVFDFKHTVVLEVSLDGRVLQSLHDPHGELLVGGSHALILSDGRLALGSYAPTDFVITDYRHSD